MKYTKQLVKDEELDKRIKEGFEKAYTLAKSGYGPRSGNALLEQIYDDPVSSHDGITNIKDYYDEDPVVNMVIRSLVQASSKNNKNVGDGTTGVVVLSCLLYREAMKLIGAGYNRFEVAEMLQESGFQAIEELKLHAKPFEPSMIKKIANISSNSDSISSLLAEIFEKLGPDAHIIIQDSEGDGVQSSLIDGFYFNKGFTYASLIKDQVNFESIHYKEPIILSEKTFTTATEIAPILKTLVAANKKEVIFIGEITQQALELVALQHRAGLLSLVIVEPAHHDSLRAVFLEDLATFLDAKILSMGAKGSDFTIDMMGYAEKTIINSKSTTFIGGDGDKVKLKERIEKLEKQLSMTTNQFDLEIISQRLNRLKGKMAIVTVGAPTELARKDLKLRIDDSISAVQASPRYGVLPGGGVALSRISSDNKFYKSYQGLLKTLAENSGLNTEKVLLRVLEKPYWQGFNFKKLNSSSEDYKTVDMFKEGVIDPAEVVIELVKNATSIVSTLITTNIALTMVNRDDKDL
jgi:chaperonin GroEL